jgi:hypothetical protein
VKCGLCGQPHTANSPSCEKRAEFIQRQQRYRNNTQRRQRPAQHQFIDAPQLADFNFPRIDPRVRANVIPMGQPRPQLAQQTGAGELFSPDELSAIFDEMVDVSSNATSKQDQLKMLYKIVQKYCPLRSN